MEAGLATSTSFGESAYIKYQNGKETYDMKSFFIGYYAGAGFDFVVRKEQSFFVRFSYETYVTDMYGDDLQVVQIKLGYTF